MRTSRSLARAVAVALPATVVLGSLSAPAWAAKTRTTPTPTITSKPANPSNKTTATFSFRDAASNATFSCSLDGAAYAICKSPKSYSSLSNKVHTFRVTAKAPKQLTSAAASYSWKVDTVAPAVPTVTVPLSPTNDATPTITMTSTDAAGSTPVSFLCSLDQATFAACSSPFAPGTLPDGIHSFAAKAVDAAGNVSAASALKTWTIDTQAPPTPQVTSGPADPTDQTSNYQFLFSEAETTAALACSVDGGTFVACDSPYSYSPSPPFTNGTHTFVVRATDAAGNSSTSSAFSWTVNTSITGASLDLSAPGTPAPLTSSTSATFTFSGQSGTCSRDGAPGTPCTNSVSYSALNDGQHTFSLTVGASKVTYTWTVDTTPPPAPVITGPSGYVASTGAVFRITESENGAAVTCSLDGQAAVPCSGGLALSGLAQGNHALTVTATDAVGNHASASRGWVVDTVAPTAAIAPTRSLLGWSTVTFSEDVTSVPASAVSMRLTGTTTALGLSLACRTSAGAAVGCGAGPLRTLLVRATGALVAGQYYTLSLGTAVVDRAGNHLAATAKPFRASTVEQENSPRASFAWRQATSPSAYGGVYHIEHLAGAAVAYRFSGTSVTWYTALSPSMGTAKVYVDGVQKATVNNYAPTVRWHVGRAISGLAAGNHLLQIVVTGARSRAATGTYVIVDAVRAGTTSVNNPAWSFGWRHVLTAAAYSGGYSVADLSGASTSFVFRGTGIAWYTAVSRGQGIARVYVDGVLKATVDNYGATTKFGIRRAIGGLTNAVHTIKVVATGTHRAGATGSQVVVDRWVVS